jgi:uncharacterized protein
MKVFLTAEWRNLINLTYRVPAEKLEPILPQGLELDLYEGQAHLSLVAFDFVNTRVKGVKIPFHVDFPEINLRYYVRTQNGHRGVVFIKELVPKHCIAFVAQRFYNEPYESFPMESLHADQGGRLQSEHKLWMDGKEYLIQTVCNGNCHTPAADTAAHFFKEHDLGFGVDKRGETLCYEVAHPVWEVRELENVKLDFDFGRVYGDEWAFLQDMKPEFQLLAVGSAIKVFHPLPLKQWLATRGNQKQETVVAVAE